MTDDLTPTVSGIMTVRNLESIVGETIESVVAQTMDAWELIVVDDASTDATADIVASFADPRIQLVRLTTNVGRARGRNAAARRARGRYLAVVDGDDLSHPERFEVLSRYLDDHPGCAVASCQVQHLLSDGTTRSITSYPVTQDGVRQRFARGSMGVSHAGCLIRRSTFERYGGYHEDSLRAQDLELFLRMAQRETLANVPDVLLTYRNTPSEASFAFWLELHRYHEYARYRSERTLSAAAAPGVLPFAQWRRSTWRCRRVYTRHVARFARDRLRQRGVG